MRKASLFLGIGFGDLLRKRGNDRYREPVVHPKSMEMPMKNLPGEGEWTEERYTTWQQHKEIAIVGGHDGFFVLLVG